MKDAFICDGVRTPIGRYGGALSGVRTDDLGAIPIRALTQRNTQVDWGRVDADEHVRPDTTLEALQGLKTPFRRDGTVTPGNASGVNDGACAMALASAEAIRIYGLSPKARVVAMATAGVEPRVMGMGPVPAIRKVLESASLTLDRMDVIELNEAFAAQALAVLRQLGLPDDAAQVNPNGGAIALGHPLGMSGARLVTTAIYELHRKGGRFGLCTMCVGVGQGIALIIERV